jgi:hypothetical protein
METFFRVTIAATGFATGTATSAGGITPIGSRPSDATTGPYFYDTDGSGTKGVTGPTTDAKALERERGLIRFERLMTHLSGLGRGFTVRDVGQTNANGDATPGALTMTIGYEQAEFLSNYGTALGNGNASGTTSLDGSTTLNTAALFLKEQIALSLNNGSSVAAANGNTVTIKNRMVATPASDDTISMQDVTIGNPHTTGEIFDNITVTLDADFEQISNQTGTDGVNP